jgi:predicted ATPase
MFDRKVTVQVHDTFAPKSDIAEVLRFVLEQRVPGEIRISIPGNGGVASIVFDGKPVHHRGAVKVQ